MDNFSLFDCALNEYKTREASDSQTPLKINCCRHINTLADGTTTLCEDCGEELKRDLSYDKEWRYYGAQDTRHNTDPNRCHIRKSEERTIYKEVENLGFSDKVVTQANRLYDEVTQGKIYRGNSRKAIIFACIFHSYKILGTPQSCEHLIEVFSLDRKIGLRGLKHVNLNAPKDSQIRTTYITAENLIVEVMDKFEAPDNQKQEVIELYSQVRN